MPRLGTPGCAGKTPAWIAWGLFDQIGEVVDRANGTSNLSNIAIQLAAGLALEDLLRHHSATGYF